MNLLKPSILGLITACAAFTLPIFSHAAPAADSVVLPTLTVMAEPELRAVTEKMMPYRVGKGIFRRHRLFVLL